MEKKAFARNQCNTYDYYLVLLHVPPSFLNIGTCTDVPQDDAGLFWNCSIML